MLDVALERMQEAGCPMAPVIVQGRTVGLLTLDNVVEYLDFRRALGEQPDQGGRSEGLLGSGMLDTRADALRG
jgi:CBS domain containing-hemolysin-like protein